MTDVLTVEIEDHVATVWLDRPDARNAMGPDLWRDLPLAMGRLDEDPEVRVVVVAARGPAFSVGIDLKAFGGFMAGAGSDDGVAGRRALQAQVTDMQRTMSSLADCRKPVIAAVQGYCLGAGVDLITACDIRLASEDAVFSVRETRMAMVADVGTLQRLPRILNPGQVADLVFTGRDFDAAEAHRIGLVSAVYADQADLVKAARELADQIAANSPLAVQGSKAVLAATDGMTTQAALDYAALWSAAFLHSNDLQEAVMAFLEKRPPTFDGT
ncbi:MAG: crotonase/enoyl-CoA hydratase family protein [Acidimicrobiia bacterium]|nr:crotonase/enoyl-CoA hydratase family protein [Acidimicrobiia bacterium]MBT8218037.1 crotonase/enoyl-CoA hydratase family protein [Acidimicrobiia bacterium]NNF09369.1 crotonase/enoyl-CoA hydratase family protein [Acidimicrobiia bacterium]NNL71192.1 crotonase/enoyl-CoA hydratase family protein [Acidimicrobiia bacterium]